jgi:hypothetical protein
VRAVWQHGREAVVCFGLEEAVWFKCDCLRASGGLPEASQYCLRMVDLEAQGDAVYGVARPLSSSLDLRSLNEHIRLQ